MHASWTRFEVPAEHVGYWVRPSMDDRMMFGTVSTWALSDEVQEWLLEHFGEFVQYPSDKTENIFFVGTYEGNFILKFKKEEDALLFKLAWL